MLTPSWIPCLTLWIICDNFAIGFALAMWNVPIARAISRTNFGEHDRGDRGGDLRQPGSHVSASAHGGNAGEKDRHDPERRHLKVAEEPRRQEDDGSREAPAEFAPPQTKKRHQTPQRRSDMERPAEHEACESLCRQG